MKLLITTLILLFGNNLYAQVADGLDKQTNLNELGREGNTGIVRTYDNRYIGVKGSPFFINDWHNGTVYLENGKIFENVPLKIDVYQNELLAISRGQTIYVTKDQVNNFLLQPDSLEEPIKFINIKSSQYKKFDEDQFLRVLHEGTKTVLEWHQKYYSEADYTGAYSANRTYDEFIQSSKFYYLDEKDQLKKLRTSIGKIAKIFESNEKAVKDFIFENNLNPKQPAQLARILRYGESLP